MPVVLQELGRRDDRREAVERDERAVEEDEVRLRRRARSRREHVVLGADPHHADVCARDIRERGEELGVTGRIRDHPPRAPDAEPVDEPARATEHRPRCRQLAIGHDGVVERDEDVEHDRHATHPREHREQEHVEPSGIHHEHDVTARHTEESPHQPWIRRDRAEDHSELALIRDLVPVRAPEIDLARHDLVARTRQEREQRAVPGEIRVERAGRDDALPHARRQ